MENRETNPNPNLDPNKKGFSPNRDADKNVRPQSDNRNNMASQNDDDGAEEKKDGGEYIQPNPKKPIDPTVESQA